MLDPWVLGRIFLLLVSVSGVGLTGLVARSEAASASCSGFSGFIVLLSLDAKGNGVHGSGQRQVVFAAKIFYRRGVT